MGVPRLGAVLAGVAVLTLSAPATARLVSASTPGSATGVAFEIGHVPECVQAVPAALGLGRHDVRLDVLVLADGVAPGRAASVMATAGRAYTPLGITLVATVRTVAFTGRSVLGLIEQAAAAVGGRRPAGADVVHVVTAKDVEELGTDRVAGGAACIGGVAFADRAFSVSEAPGAGAGVTPLVAAKVAAHEIGHLLGGHHHYANCMEGLLALGTGETAPCTLMFSAADLAALRFSTLNALVVRGHAEAYPAG